jgi:hypothetical protein
MFFKLYKRVFCKNKIKNSLQNVAILLRNNRDCRLNIDQRYFLETKALIKELIAHGILQREHRGHCLPGYVH